MGKAVPKVAINKHWGQTFLASNVFHPHVFTRYGLKQTVATVQLKSINNVEAAYGVANLVPTTFAATKNHASQMATTGATLNIQNIPHTLYST